jgi:hypothetical protein
MTRREFVAAPAPAAATPAVKMARTEKHKLVHSSGASYGELYDLSRDPYEYDNLYADARHAGCTRRNVSPALRLDGGEPGPHAGAGAGPEVETSNETVLQEVETANAPPLGDAGALRL